MFNSPTTNQFIINRTMFVKSIIKLLQSSGVAERSRGVARGMRRDGDFAVSMRALTVMKVHNKLTCTSRVQHDHFRL